MKVTLVIFAFGVFLLSNSLMAATPKPQVIYGEDNRVDVYESQNSVFVELARSTAAMIGGGNISVMGAETQISGPTFQSRMSLCSEERFSQQISAANCSGFLVAENVLVTAGHCIKSEFDCQSFKWVFDYKVETPDQKSINVPSSSVYSCKRIMTRTLDNYNKDDYAMIELDRKVTDRRPLSFRRSGKVSVGAELVVIGHPSGLPTKIADKANVRSLEKRYFTANLDTYGGNSGSAVFNVATGEVEGILVRGENDYVSEGSCRVSNVCTNDGCRGEDVTYITNVPGITKL